MGFYPKESPHFVKIDKADALTENNVFFQVVLHMLGDWVSAPTEGIFNNSELTQMSVLVYHPEEGWLKVWWFIN